MDTAELTFVNSVWQYIDTCIMVERIKKIMELKGLSPTQLADTIEVPRATISHILSERNKPSLDVVLKIMGTFKDVNMNWLLLGEGEATAADSYTDSRKDNRVPASPKAQPPTVSDTMAMDQQLGKKIEQIVIFYSDNSFTSFRPDHT